MSALRQPRARRRQRQPSLLRRHCRRAAMSQAGPVATRHYCVIAADIFFFIFFISLRH